MKLLIIPFSFLLLFCSCSKQSDKSTESKKIDTVDSTPVKMESQSGNSAKGKDEVSNTTDIKDNSFSKLPFDKNDIPSDCIYKGKIIEGGRWKDKNGENILLISQTEVKRVNQDVRNQYLYAYLYILSSTKWNLSWNITDYVESYCDVEAKYIPGTLDITDIDNDGIAENAFIYKLDGRCDVSPIPIKLMMHSGDKKLVIRGDTRVDIGNGEKAGGKKTFDDAFNSVPVSYKEYASKKWDNFIKENNNP